MSDRPLKIAFHTLGCKLNFSETSAIGRKLEEASFKKVSFEESADIYFIHGCTVTEAADKKCRYIIKKTIRQFPESFIVVAGCYAQLRHEEIAGIPGVDLILGTNEKYDLIKYLGNISKREKPEIHISGMNQLTLFNPSYSGGERTRAFLKVQDGCDYSCTYCTIPMARGKSRNQPVSSCVKDATKIAEKGIKEIVLTGVNIGDFGKSTGEAFYDLLQALVKINGIERYRISSIEPNLLTDDIIKLVAENKKLMPHFHIPLQSGSERILGKMRRRYTRDVFESAVIKIRKLMPLAGIGADVIVGFPGETEEDFMVTYEFLRSLDLSYLHVFSYSERKGTPADVLPDRIDKSTIHLRSNKLHSLSKTKKMEFNEKCKGMEADILWENEELPGYIAGFTGNYIRAFTAYDSALRGKITRHKLKVTDENGNFIV